MPSKSLFTASGNFGSLDKFDAKSAEFTCLFLHVLHQGHDRVYVTAEMLLTCHRGYLDAYASLWFAPQSTDLLYFQLGSLDFPHWMSLAPFHAVSPFRFVLFQLIGRVDH